MPISINVLIILVLCLISGFFSAAETAIFSLSKLEKRRLIERHPRSSKWVINHLDQPRRALVTILIGNLMVNTLAASVATLMFLEILGPARTGLAMAAFAVFFILACEILPKIIAVRKNEAVALILSYPLEIFTFFLYPVRRITRWITDWILSFLVPEKKARVDLISEEELKAMVKIGQEEGVIDLEERKMIHKLFELGERPVKSIMTPRIDVVALDLEDSMDRHVAIMRKSHFSNFPVYQGSVDHVLGVVSAQEYMLSPDKNLKLLVRQPLYVPETKQIDDLLGEFKKKNINFAVCVDEYGGTAGVVTLEDILEEIFGEYYDEYAKVEQAIRPLGAKEFIVEAKISLSDFNEAFNLHLEAQEAATLGGYILEKMGEVPEKGKELEISGFQIRIYEVVRQRIRSVIVRPQND